VSRLRMLVVGQTFPWPEITGARMRLANVIRGLSRLGDVDLFTLVDPERADLVSPPHHIRRAETAPRRLLPFPPLRRVGWLAAGSLPRALTVFDLRSVRERFAAWADPRYDLVWFHRVESFAALAPLVQGPTIVDFDDLAERHGPLTGSNGMSSPQAENRGWRRWAGRLQEARDYRLWLDLQRGAAARAQAVVVCSEKDRRRLAGPHSAVIPNGYTAPAHPLGRVVVADPPVILFAGLLTYPPNRDAAAVLATRIAPLVRERLPAVQIRLTGRAGDPVARLGDPPRVVVTGFVPDMAVELARADIVAVPLRVGGGTRIKILEAFAHRIPVVSTTAGATGLDVVHGRDLLIADDPQAFARACVALLTDQEQRGRLAEAAHRLFLEQYRWERIHDAVAALAARVAQAEVTA